MSVGVPNKTRNFVCQQCGVVFPAYRPTRKWCTRRCMRIATKIKNPDYGKAWVRPQRTFYYKEWYHKHRDVLLERARKALKKRRIEIPWHQMLNATRTRAKTRGLEFDLTPEWAKARWTGKCELSGIPFNLFVTRNEPKTFCCTIDRIKPRGGYTQDNCRFILWSINAFKGVESDEEMMRIVNAMVYQYKDQRGQGG